MPHEPIRFIEVSHVIEAGMVTYPGLPPPEVKVIVDHDTSRERYQNKSEFLIASLHLCGNTGTYVDAPLHRHRGAVDLAGLSLDRLAHVPARVFDARSLGRSVGPDLFAGSDLRGSAVLIRTDFSQHWRTERYGRENPFLTADTCERLVSAGVAFVGIDSLNIDDIADLARPAHTILLGAGIPICEHMTNLAALPANGGRLHAVPIAWRGGATFPVRAYVQMPG
ncbi:MAG: cyclase family protein [Steroidobacteraceae bacterium]|nr:cyclase family protein [Steroidobacteraceae bacterium]